MDSLRMKLKTATQAAHTQIEANPVLARLTGKDLTLDQYRAILARYFGFFTALEDQLLKANVTSEVNDFESRRRTPRRSTTGRRRWHRAVAARSARQAHQHALS